VERFCFLLDLSLLLCFLLNPTRAVVASGHIFGRGPLSVAEVAVMRSDLSARVESYSRGCG
jgi:hypothetical protein